MEMEMGLLIERGVGLEGSNACGKGLCGSGY